MTRIFSLFICLLLAASTAHAQKRKKASAWTKDLHHAWKVTRLEIPGERGDLFEGKSEDRPVIEFFEDNSFVGEMEDEFIRDVFYTFESGGDRFLVLSSVTFKIEKLKGGIMELRVSVPIAPAPSAITVHLEAATEPVMLSKEKLYQSWKIENYYSYARDYSDNPRFVINLNRNGKFFLYQDSTLTSGKWEFKNNVIEIQYPDSKTQKYSVKMLAKRRLILSVEGYRDSMIAFSKSYYSPEELLWKKKNTVNAPPLTDYDEPTTVDSTVVSDTSVTISRLDPPPAPPMQEPYEPTKTDDELLIDTFISEGIVVFGTNEGSSSDEKVKIIFSKDSTYVITYGKKTEKGKWFFMSAKNVIILETMGVQRYSPVTISRNYPVNDDEIKILSFILTLPGEKELKKVFFTPEKK